MPPPKATSLFTALLATMLLFGCAADATLEPAPQRETSPATRSAASPPASPYPDSAPSSELAPAPETPDVVRAVVTRHTDGDTAWFRLEKAGEEKVRFIGIDTPEVYGEVEPYGKEASAYTASAIPIGATVWLETDIELRDRYGRLLAYVWLQRPLSDSDAETRAKMLNARLLIDGYARIATFPPNVRYVDYFTLYQAEAREHGRGLWGL